jgi:hypothetical protein
MWQRWSYRLAGPSLLRRGSILQPKAFFFIIMRCQ